MNAGQSIQYTLPKVEDDLEDNVLTKVDLGTALTFVDYFKGTFDIKPGKKISGRFQVNIILLDDNEDPKMSKHNFTIIVNPFVER